MASPDVFSHPPNIRGRGSSLNPGLGRGRPLSRNKQWVANEASPRTGADGERWDRGGHHGRGRGRGAPRGHRKFPNATLRNTPTTQSPSPFPSPPKPPEQTHQDTEELELLPQLDEPVIETQEERDKFWQELVAARERERKQAIAEGKMDDPLVPKRLEDAITMVGTCPDMCPRHERYRREREGQLDRWETIPGTRRIDHQRAVKRYERAVGDKTIPSDLRPPYVLKKTLDYLFHDLLPRGGMEGTYQFIRDRSRAVRNDFTMQHLTGHSAMECYDRCARFHILAIHLGRAISGFDLAMEEQQFMNTLQSLKEFYEDQRGKYQSPTELEMRVYHRLIHIRDQKERPENIPDHIRLHPVFKLVTQFRLHVQEISSPIDKKSRLLVDDRAREIFGQLAAVLREEGNTVMVYLVACILERFFGPEEIDDIEGIRGDLSLSDVIDGKSGAQQYVQDGDEEMEEFTQGEETETETEQEQVSLSLFPPAQSLQNNVFAIPQSQPPAPPQQSNVFAVPQSQPTPPPPVVPEKSAFASLVATPNVFGTAAFGATATGSVFGGSVKSSGTSPSVPATTQYPAPTAPLPTPPPPSPAPFANIFSISRPSNVNGTFTASRPPAANKPAPTPLFPTGSLFSAKPPATAAQTNEGPLQLQTSRPLSLNPQAPVFSPPLFQLPQSKPSSSSVPPPPQIAQEDSISTSVTPSEVTPSPLITRAKSGSFSNSRASATPPPLKIDTVFPSSASTSMPPLPPPVPSPREPPALGKIQPVSLPSTPTTNIPPPNPLLSHIKGNLGTPFGPSSSANAGPLSPLFMQSPTASPFAPSSPSGGSPRQPPMSKGNQLALGLLGLNGNGKGKAPERRPAAIAASEPSAEILTRMEERAMAFQRSGLVVKESFKQWLDKTVAKAEYLEAIRQSDAYREKIRLQQSQARSEGAGTPDKKRRISVTSRPTLESPQRKRARKRVSSTYQPPMTDDQLAQRFKEKHEDRERRWAVGSFLRTFQAHIKHTVNPDHMPSISQIWVSTNPASDATAIWIETKFDIPNSGEWTSETVFSIPVSKTARTSQAYPGVIVFECTPIEGVQDEIERKYRILDDCARLRDIVENIPKRRFYNPSLLALCWARDSEKYAATDFFDMVNKFVKDGVLKSHLVLPMNSSDSDPDGKFSAALDNLSLDLVGERVQEFSIKELYKEFTPSLTSFITEWVLTCSNADYLNWKLYNLVVHGSIALLNDISRRVVELCKIPENALLVLPEFQDLVMDDSDSAYEAVEDWLSTFPPQKDVSHILFDLESHRNIEQEFPAQIFLDHIVQLVEELLERSASVIGAKTFLVLAEDSSASFDGFEEGLKPWRIKLSQRLNTTSRRSPKRRSHSMDTSEASFVSPESKRARLSTPSINGDITPFSSPMLNGHSTITATATATATTATPSPSQSMASLPPLEPAQPVVTAAMLRAFTKDLKKKYMRSS